MAVCARFAVGRNHAASVMELVTSRVALSGTRMRSSSPSNASAPFTRPADGTGPQVKLPLLPLPDESAATKPVVSSSFHCPTRVLRSSRDSSCSRDSPPIFRLRRLARLTRRDAKDDTPSNSPTLFKPRDARFLLPFIFVLPVVQAAADRVCHEGERSSTMLRGVSCET